MDKPSGGWETSGVGPKRRRDKYCMQELKQKQKNYDNT
jgi:hypothetical protein